MEVQDNWRMELPNTWVNRMTTTSVWSRTAWSRRERARSRREQAHTRRERACARRERRNSCRERGGSRRFSSGTGLFYSRTGLFYSRTGSFYSRTGLFYSSRTEQFSSRTGPCSSRTGRARRERVVNQREAVPDENRGAYRITERYREWGCHRLIHPPIQQTHAANQLSQPIHPTPHTCHRSFLVHSMPASLLSIFCQLA